MFGFLYLLMNSIVIASLMLILLSNSRTYSKREGAMAPRREENKEKYFATS